MTRYLMPVFMLALICAGALQADEKADKLRVLHEKFSNRVVVLTWSSTTSAMGQTIESKGATTGLLVGKGGLVLISNQPLSNNVGGMASMFGRGESTGPENFEVQLIRDGVPGRIDATEALESADENLRWYGAKLGGDLEPLSFTGEAAVPALGEEVVIIGAHDATLNFARFFRTARINCVVEDGKYYGLDGSLGDCLGGLVVTLDGQVIGIVGQKKGEEEAAAGGGGFGRILGGLNDPSKAMGNRVLITPAVFKDAHKTAQETVLKDGFHSGAAPTTTPEPTNPEETPLFRGTVAKVTWREKQKDLYVLIDVPEGQEAPAMNTKVNIISADGKVAAELEVTRRFNDPLVPESRYDQIGGFLADAEQKLKIEIGWKVVIPAKKLPPATPDKGFRGIERFTKMGADVLKDNYGGVKVGFTVSQIPAKDSQTRAAGVKNGDVIYQVNDKPVTDEMTLKDFLKLLQEQEGEVTLHVVRRGGEKVEIKVAE
ncbi:MAG: hypothetical protein K8I27_15530 [Planctomycetes bacterium]|nr:hypothetical protein [Planctomycetota bacterium]